MDDLEITKLCKEAMGISDCTEFMTPERAAIAKKFDPLHDDAQAMALVKRFRLKADPHYPTYGEDAMRMWLVEGNASLDLNRAICECVAKIQVARKAGQQNRSSSAE